MSQIINEFVTLNAIRCARCDIVFALTDSFQDRRRQDGGDFYCPSGHVNHYGNGGENGRLKRELEQKQRELTASKCETMAEKLKRETIEAESAAKIKSMERKTKHGVCPCCKRTFHSLRDHMKKQHPEYGPKQKAKLP